MRYYITLITVVFSYSFILAQTDSLVLRPGPSTSKDATVWSVFPTTNYGNTQEATLTAWTNGGSPSTKRYYVEFDMTSIPPGTVVDSAYLFYYNNPTAPSHGGQHSGANGFIVKRVTSIWDEASITYANQPSSTNTNQVTVPATTSSNQNFKIDVTALVQDQMTFGNNGFFLRLVNESIYRAIVCASSDHTVAAYRPMLKVYYPGCFDVEAGFEESITNNTVQFTDTTQSNTAYSYYWDFGDGTFSLLQNPTKTYTSASSYTVCLTVEDSCGIDTTCRVISLCNPGTAAIYYNVAGLSVQFQATPIGAQSYWWNFGDGNFSTLQNPLYTYSTGGLYIVCLATTDSCGTDTTCQEVYISGIGLDENSQKVFAVYPNPAVDVVQIQGEFQSGVLVQLYSLSGSMILEQEVKNEILDIAELPSGVYVLKVLLDGIEEVHRLVKY
jgi:hypothetical protein